ncbi:MAG: hypothetical protein L0216_07895 [Planctomycetales bacterium]|nr:hypothetical protein [Planctomycetales bacterium]
MRPTRLACVRCVLAGVGLVPRGEQAPILLATLDITPATLWWDDAGRMALCGCGWRRIPSASLEQAVPGP